MRNYSTKTKTTNGSPSRRRAVSDVAWEVVAVSRMNIEELDDGVEITIRGKAAEIPALKNSKRPGSNSTNPDHLGRIYALDALYAAEMRNRKPIAFGETLMHMVAIIGFRNVAFDADNAFTTLRDWLEPPTKQSGRRRRGWGVGVVDNDRYILGFPLTARELGSKDTNTYISIRKFENVLDHLETFVHRISHLRIGAHT